MSTIIVSIFIIIVIGFAIRSLMHKEGCGDGCSCSSKKCSKDGYDLYKEYKRKKI